MPADPIWGSLISGGMGIAGTLLGGTIAAFFQKRGSDRKDHLSQQINRNTVAAEMESISSSEQVIFEFDVLKDYFSNLPNYPMEAEIATTIAPK